VRSVDAGSFWCGDEADDRLIPFYFSTLRNFVLK